MAPLPPSAKTAFGSLVAHKIEESGRTVKEVAKRLKATPASQFTRWKKGLWTYIPPEKLVEIVETVTDDPREQADLIIAYLHDVTPLKFRPVLTFAQKGDIPFSIADGEAPWRDPMRRRLDVLAEAYEKSPDLALMVDNLVAWAKRISPSAPQASQIFRDPVEKRTNRRSKK